jgi:hypothetical protein
MKQRFYLPTDYAEIVASKAKNAGVSPEIYLQALIAQDQICGGVNPPAPASTAKPPETTNEGIQLSGEWASMGL